MEKLLSATRPLSFGGFIVHMIWTGLLLAGICLGANHFIGHGYHNMPLAYFVMIIGASVQLGVVILLLIRLRAPKN